MPAQEEVLITDRTQIMVVTTHILTNIQVLIRVQEVQEFHITQDSNRCLQFPHHLITTMPINNTSTVSIKILLSMTLRIFIVWRRILYFMSLLILIN